MTKKQRLQGTRDKVKALLKLHKQYACCFQDGSYPYPCPCVDSTKEIDCDDCFALAILNVRDSERQRLIAVIDSDQTPPSEKTDRGNLKYGGMMASDMIREGWRKLILEEEKLILED